MKKIIILFIVLLSALTTVTAKTYYIAINGNDDTGTGSITEPYATIMKGQTVAVGGDTVYIRGGSYTMTNSNISAYVTLGPYAVVNNLNKSGSSASKRIYYWAYPGEKPVFDFSDVKLSGYRVTAFFVTGSYIHLKGLEVTGMQVTITTHTQSECFRNQGSYNIYENLCMHDGMGIGFYLQSGSNNLVLNCDAYRNWDNVSETKKGSNVDGFGFHPSKGSTGNVIRGCRAWFNSDDGYDCINAYETVVFDNCQAFYNGYNSSFTSLGDGNGFKAGGYGQAPVVSKLPSPVPSHLVRFCVAYRNKSNGFYANHHVEKEILFYNNTAFRNATNYNMLSQKITKSSFTGNDTTLDCPGIRHKLRNNVSYKYSSYRDTLNIGTSDMLYNSFTPGSGITVNGNDFISLDEALLVAPRLADGSLPDTDFLRLQPSSDLIDKGQNIGFAYSGAAPDLGAFEYQQQTPVDVLPVKSLLFFPDPVSDKLNFTGSSDKNIEIFNCEGKRMLNLKVTYSVDVSNLPAGIYIIRIKADDEKPVISKFIKR